MKVSDLARKYALTNEQLIEYLLLNGININNDHYEIDTSNNKIKNLLNRLNITKKRNHHNRSGLKSIKIIGLFGKYNYNLEFQKDIIIWISQNGVGKTTVLNIIVAILTGDEATLYSIDFKEIIINIDNKEYVFNKWSKKTQSKFEIDEINLLLNELSQYLPRSLLMELRKDLMMKKFDLKLWDTIQYILLDNARFDSEILLHKIRKLKRQYYSNMSNQLKELANKLNEEVLFYPTYRRVEVGLDRILINKSSREDMILNLKYMSFGMNDVEERINNLLDKMRTEANRAYIEMNAKIISELLSNNVDHYLSNRFFIDTHKTEVVIKRIGENRIKDAKRLIEVLENLSKNNSSNINFLAYYLLKLGEIYDSQEAIDIKLSSFAKVCSKYLSGKKIVYDEALLTMNVLNSSNEKISLKDLSSGEKQIISIFSKVYLDVTSPCIFIIDEPEISLSIEWQKEFLKDVYDSGKIALLIATTHSPFIFKNDYMDYVVELERDMED